MTTETPKLLTEAEAKALYVAAGSAEAFVAGLNERGLIAEEPEPERSPEVDEIADAHRLNLSAMPRVEAALDAALRRGMELQREKLTREMVERAVDRATDDCNDSRWDDNFAQFLHTAIQDALQ